MVSETYELAAYDPSGLSLEKHGRLHTITWDVSGRSIRASVINPTRRGNLLRHNPNLTFHSYYGYSLGDFHEFFVYGVDDGAEIEMPGATVLVGDTSPLAMVLFEGDYHRKAHGDEWEYYKTTIQIEGLPEDQLEAYLLKTLHILDDHSLEAVGLIPFGPVEFWEAPELAAPPDSIAAVPLDLEPMRFLWRGRREYTNESACLQFYRVLEFYAFFEIQKGVAALRSDSSLTDREFLSKVAALVYRDEKTPIVRLVERLAGKRLLARAVAKGLISKPTGKALGEAMYEFRNSFVHAKYIHRTLIHAPSILQEEDVTHQWRPALFQLAKSAIAKFSQKRRKRAG